MKFFHWLFPQPKISRNNTHARTSESKSVRMNFFDAFVNSITLFGFNLIFFFICFVLIRTFWFVIYKLPPYSFQCIVCILHVYFFLLFDIYEHEWILHWTFAQKMCWNKIVWWIYLHFFIDLFLLFAISFDCWWWLAAVVVAFLR